MSELVDFHVHSNRSCDGDFSPAELIGFAREKGFRAISIADHDTVAAYPEAVDLGREAGVEVIPSIEVTTLYAGREFHLLLPFVDWESAAIAAIIESQTRCRTEEAIDRIEKVRKLGFAITWDDVREKVNGTPPLGVKIAQILLDNPENEKNPVLEFFYRKENRPFAPYMFYKEFFAEGKHAYVPKRFINLLDVLAETAATGGVPVLSHPGAYFQQTTREDAGLSGSTAWPGSRFTPSITRPTRSSSTAAWPRNSTLCPRPGRTFTAGSSPTWPSGRSGKVAIGWSSA